MEVWNSLERDQDIFTHGHEGIMQAFIHQLQDKYLLHFELESDQQQVAHCVHLLLVT